MKSASNKPQLEEIPLLRGGNVVSSFAGSFGAGLRETRLTAMLGYLIAQAPESLKGLLPFMKGIRSVSLESYHGLDRSDILIQTGDGDVVVEAKVDATDPFVQSRKYRAAKRVLVTAFTPGSRHADLRNTIYVRWSEVASHLKPLRASINPAIKFISTDLIRYLEEHHMISRPNPVEIYAREINNEETFDLFLRGRIYHCLHKGNSRLPEALYFAPHFGQFLSELRPGIRPGISYLARIEAVEVVDRWEEFRRCVRAERGEAWGRQNRKLLEGIKWRGSRPHSVVFLGEPRLVFNPPIPKSNLQEASGILVKHFFSFEDLFAGWGS